MFSSMCRSTAHGSEEISKTKTKNVKNVRDKPFSILTQAFLIAVAIGLQSDRKLKPYDSAQLIRGESLRRDKNYDSFKQLIKAKFGAKTDSDVVNLMVQFAEFGVKELYNEFHKTGDIDFIRLSKLGAVNG